MNTSSGSDNVRDRDGPIVSAIPPEECLAPLFIKAELELRR